MVAADESDFPALRRLQPTDKFSVFKVKLPKPNEVVVEHERDETVGRGTALDTSVSLLRFECNVRVISIARQPKPTVQQRRSQRTEPLPLVDIAAGKATLVVKTKSG
ncbi:hypothetical protein [Arthrobacter sp. Z4-13]